MFSEHTAQTVPVDGLHIVVGGADELSHCPDLESICHNAVEFAQSQLGLERCAIFLEESGFLRGTYGMNMRGEIQEEHRQRFPINEVWLERIQALEPLGRCWQMVEDTHYEWDGEQAHAVGQGWIALTPIHSAQKLIGLFCNDTAISGNALDPATQELVSVFCSLVGSILERKRTEQALAEEHNLLRTLIDSMPDYIYAKDKDARFELANSAITRLVGLDNSEQMIGKSDFEIFPRDLATQYYADDNTVLHREQPLINREELTGGKNGKRQWVLTSKIPLRDLKGNVVGLVGVTRDITQLKQTQEALRQANDQLEQRVQARVAELGHAYTSLQTEMAERKAAEAALTKERNLLRTLIDTVPANVYIKDNQSRFIDANSETALKLGAKSVSDIIGKTDFDFFTTDLAEKYYADEQGILQTGKPLLNIEEPTYDQRSEQPLWFLTTKAPIRDEYGEVIGLVGVGLDISERKATQEELTQERNLLRTLIDLLPAEIYVKDTQSRFVNANIAVARNVGLRSPEELIGKTDFDFTTRENALRYYQAEQELMASDTVIANEETLNPDKTVWRVENKCPLRDSQGQIVGLVGFNWDITERKQTEQARRESERLRIELEKEKELGDLKTRLMITISHEFRTPLSVVQASTDLLEQYFDRMPVDKRTEHLYKVQGQVRKLTRMLEEISLLIHSKFERLALNREVTDLKVFCETILLQDFDEARQRVVFHIDDSVPCLMLDGRRMHYVLTNLLSNALKYSGGEVALGVFNRGADVLIQVKDQGLGIPKEEQAQIFEPFYRARNVGMIGGTGLGLSIVKEIVELHKGTIHIESEVNRGTQVSVFLPKS